MQAKPNNPKLLTSSVRVLTSGEYTCFHHINYDRNIFIYFKKSCDWIIHSEQMATCFFYLYFPLISLEVESCIYNILLLFNILVWIKPATQQNPIISGHTRQIWVTLIPSLNSNVSQ